MVAFRERVLSKDRSFREVPAVTARFTLAVPCVVSCSVAVRAADEPRIPVVTVE